MSYISKIQTPDGVTHQVKANIYYVEGNEGDTQGNWTGTNTDIISYYDGLTIIYLPLIGADTVTTLNINNLGALTCYATKNVPLRSDYPAHCNICFTYVGGKWIGTNYNAATADRLNHTLTIGQYQYDGSENVIVPVYDGQSQL